MNWAAKLVKLRTRARVLCLKEADIFLDCRLLLKLSDVPPTWSYATEAARKPVTSGA